MLYAQSTRAQTEWHAARHDRSERACTAPERLDAPLGPPACATSGSAANVRRTGSSSTLALSFYSDVDMRCVDLTPSSPARPRRVHCVPKLGPPAPTRAPTEPHDSPPLTMRARSTVFCAGSLTTCSSSRGHAPGSSSKLHMEVVHRRRLCSGCAGGLHRSTRSLGPPQTKLRAGLEPTTRSTGILAAPQGRRARA